MEKYFNYDRSLKYGYGSFRLLIVVYLSFFKSFSVYSKHPFTLNEFFYTPPASLHSYFSTNRYLGHIAIGSIGAMINVNITNSFFANLALLGFLGCVCFWDIQFDYAVLIYLMKTMGGDFIAGKLDTTEWKLVLFFVFIVLAPLSYFMHVSHSENLQVFLSYSRIFSILFIEQIICEYGDAHLEDWIFFRHRFSFEVANLGILLLLPEMKDHERLVLNVDLVTCFFYRFTNFLLIIYKSQDEISRFFQMIFFRILGIISGTNLMIVRDPDLAVLVMKQSNHKGNALEKYMASPAWLPILSLESVDGELWKSMRENFDILIKHLPDVSKLTTITNKHVAQLTERTSSTSILIDANVIARLTALCFVEYCLDLECNSNQLDLFVAGSWEWRKEISIRGKGDKNIKQAVIQVFIEELLAKSPMWELFEEKWREPEYFSLLLQPFLISPMINVGDILCAVKLTNDGPPCSIENVIRKMHPFPIFERYIEHDIIQNGATAIKANTQVIMFTSDFNNCSNDNNSWPIFGSGTRMCAGRHLALPFLKILASDLAVLGDNFQPLKGHKFSGRHKDGQVDSVHEYVYFICTVLSALVRSGPVKTT